MDVLSDVLKAVKLHGAVFFNGEFSAPWCAREPDSCTMASYLSVQATHVMIFHLVTEGCAYARIEQEGRPLSLDAGDIVMFPHGDAHLLGNGPPVPPLDSAAQFRHLVANGGILTNRVKGGELTRLICGYLACDRELSQVFLAGLPPIVKINIRDSAAGQWLEHSLRYSVDHVEASAPAGRQSLPNCRKCCSWKPYAGTSPNCRPRKPVGWPACAIRRWAAPWLCYTADRRNPGPLPCWPRPWECRDRCLQSDSGITWPILRSVISHAGACTWPPSR